MARFSKKGAKTTQEIPTASLPDIIFMLLIFFMVTTVLRETELLVQINRPSAEAVEKIDQKRLVQNIYLGPVIDDPERDAVQINDALIEDVTDIRDLMFLRLGEEPRTIVSLQVDGGVETGTLYEVQQELREADALRVNYSTVTEQAGS